MASTTNNNSPVVNPPYDLQYFTGNQASIYIGDVLIDEVISFQYSVRQSKSPIYGYASQLFDAVAPGQVLVQGSFVVNFIESGYLWLVLNRYKKFANKVDIALEKLGVPNSSTIRSNPFSKITTDKDNIVTLSQNNIQRLVNNQASTDEKMEAYKSLANYATLNFNADPKSAFQQIVNTFEDEVWQDNLNDIDLSGRRVDDNMYDNFDMFVVFGDFSKPGTSSTVRRIRGVHLLGQSQAVELGQQVFEQYDFFAKTII